MFWSVLGCVPVGMVTAALIATNSKRAAEQRPIIARWLHLGLGVYAASSIHPPRHLQLGIETAYPGGAASSVKREASTTVVCWGLLGWFIGYAPVKCFNRRRRGLRATPSQPRASLGPRF